MTPPVRPLSLPLAMAGVGTWAVVAYDQWGRVGVGALELQTRAALGLASLMLFLVGFVWEMFREARGLQPVRGVDWPPVLLQLLCALVNVATVPGMSSSVLLVIAASQLADAPLRVAAALLIPANLFLWWVFYNIWGFQEASVSVGLFVGFQGFALFTMRLARDAEHARAHLSSVNAELMATRDLLADAARDAERLRLSRELHDVAGHKLTALKLNLDMALRDPAGAATRTEVSRTLVSELLADVRAVVTALRSHDGLDLRQALETLAANLPGARIRIQIDDRLRGVEAAVAEVLLRCVQEAITNALRHGGAQSIIVELGRETDSLRLSVRDDGRGNPNLKPGNGLVGMRERVAALDGELEVESSLRTGTELRVRIPLSIEAGRSP